MHLREWGRGLVRAAERISSVIGFTAGEERLVLFLIGAFFLGFALTLIGVGERPAPIVDYREPDSVFAARSGLTGSAESTVVSPAPIAHAAPAAHPGGPVDLNRAGKDDLLTLPGIGPTLAERILAYRAATRFRSVNDLLNVKGIGRKKLERLAPLCTVNK